MFIYLYYNLHILPSVGSYREACNPSYLIGEHHTTDGFFISTKDGKSWDEVS